MAEAIIGLSAIFITAVIMFGIGIYDLKSSKPVGFYSGEKPPSPDKITDIKAYNTGHGYMWIAYGAIIVLTGILMTVFMYNDIAGVIICIAGFVLPLPAMIWYHKRLDKEYTRGGYIR